MFGADTWEAAESTMQKQAATLAVQKAGLQNRDIRLLFAGDLLAQTVASSFGTAGLGMIFVPKQRELVNGKKVEGKITTNTSDDTKTIKFEINSLKDEIVSLTNKLDMINKEIAERVNELLKYEKEM